MAAARGDIDEARGGLCRLFRSLPARRSSRTVRRGSDDFFYGD